MLLCSRCDLKKIYIQYVNPNFFQKTSDGKNVPYFIIKNLKLIADGFLKKMCDGAYLFSLNKAIRKYHSQLKKKSEIFLII